MNLTLASTIEFSFSPTAAAWWVSILAVVVVLVLGFLACQRNQWRRTTVMLESLRLLLVILAASLLFQPEVLRTDEPPARGTLAVLLDKTGSMKTEDVREQGATVISREAQLAELEKQEPWQDLTERFNVDVRSFDDQIEGEVEPGTDLNQALLDVVEDYTDLRAILLLTDADANAGNSPIEAAAKMQQKQVVLEGVVLGEDKRLPDLAMTRFDAPSFTIVDDQTQLPFRVRNSFDSELRTQLELVEDGVVVKTKELVLPPFTEVDDSIYWKAPEEGNYTLSLRVPLQAGELLEDNNEREVVLAAKPQSIRVLVIETAPRWEYRYMRNAFYRDPGVELETLLFHPNKQMGMGGGPGYIDQFPATLEQLSKYDVVVIGDVPMDDERHLTREQCEMLRDLVQKQASGLVFLPGSRGHIFTHEDGPLGEILPVTLDSSIKEGSSSKLPQNIELTPAGRGSLLTLLADQESDNAGVWRNLPGFYWWAPVEKALGGAEVLAVHETRSNLYGRIPLIVTRQAERGKVLFMATDGAWRWRRGVEDKYHYRFWGQVARWMSYQRQMAAGEYLRMYYRPENPSLGDVVTVQANAFGRDGIPLAEGTVNMELTRPDGSVRRWKLRGPDAEGNGAFEGEFSVESRGEYLLKASCPENQDSVEAKIVVAGSSREQIGQPAQPRLLEQVAQLTGGGIVSATQLDTVLASLNDMPKPRPTVEIIRLWSNAWTLILLALGFLLFWILRKLNGQL